MTVSDKTKSPPDFSGLVNADRGEVDRRIFWEPEIYQTELQQIFSRCWLFVAHESQIPNPNDFITTTMGEDQVIVVRQKDHSIKAFLNSCTHRGNRIAFAEKGNARGFACNYHGWSFGIDGALNGMPQSEFYESCPGFKKCDHNLKSVANIESYKGLIFATFDPNAPTLMDYFGDFTWYLDIILDNDEGGTEFLPGCTKSVIKTNWKFAADNFVGDAYHAEWTHDSGAHAMLGQGVNFGSFADSVHISVNGHGWSTNMDKFGNLRTLGEPLIEDYHRSRWQQVVNRLGETRSRMLAAISSVTVFPNFSFLPGQNTFRVWQPRGADEIELHTWVLVNKNMPQKVKEAYRRGAMMTFSPSGVFEMDDGENWEFSTRSNSGYVTRHQQLSYHLGLGTDIQSNELPGRISKGLINETNHRHYYQRWADLMAAKPWSNIPDRKR